MTTSEQSLGGAFQTAVEALNITWKAWKPKILTQFVFVPVGILLMLLACFGVDTLFTHIHVKFPASVACLLLLFAALVGSEQVLGHHRTRKIVGWIEIPAGWALRWMNIFFGPSFVSLPLSPKVGIIEVLKMIAVFLIGFVVMYILCAYFTRLIQLLMGTSKRSAASRGEELHVSDTDDIPMTAPTPRAAATPFSDADDPTHTPAPASPPSGLSPSPSGIALNTLAPAHLKPEPAADQQDPVPPSTLPRSGSASPPPSPHQPTPSNTRAQRWAAVMTTHQNAALYLFILLFAGLPVYFGAHYAMPLHLAVSILMFQASMQIPASWRRFLHPVLVSALFTVLIIWAFGAMRGLSLTHTLHEYKTGSTYLQLWRAAPGTLPAPGAGDMFGTVLDASIVALALPMYQYRRELREHFVAIVVPNVAMSIASLFGYPWVCYAIGISAERSLAFSSRSLTLALAIPAVTNLGGDLYTTAAVAIMSGVVGVLVGNKLLALVRIPEDDYVTRGVTMGGNSSALGTALLLRTDPRAAALSSLSMSLFGAITVLFTSIPTITHVVRELVGLS
ncbi:hypothetical protein TD95_000723 [Thielaviopsis punctulata]|uniref:LrgB-like protein n=1 Tax=Thielaviopsis punctulata TaxID=72032 RepID=A0A0F4ZLZ6_9PEZI|nr:hypothetical protein TD95_000723 [Thielaviopsis punctulata]